MAQDDFYFLFSLNELFVVVIEDIEKSLCLQDSDGHHLLDFAHVLLKDMLVELIDLVVSFLLSGFGHGIEILRTEISHIKTVWVEVIRLWELILFLFLELIDEDRSLQLDKLSVVGLKIIELFVADGLELLRLHDPFYFILVILAVLDFEVVLNPLGHDGNKSFFEFFGLFIYWLLSKLGDSPLQFTSLIHSEIIVQLSFATDNIISSVNFSVWLDNFVILSFAPSLSWWDK